MKKRIVAVFVALALTLCQLPFAAKAADKYGSRPIYIGDAETDYMAEQTLKQIPTQGKTTVQKIQAVYDWIEKNCRRDGTVSKTYFDTKALKPQITAFAQKTEAAFDRGDILLRYQFSSKAYDSAYGLLSDYDCNDYIDYFSNYMMKYRIGSCANFSALLALLLGHIGLDCHVIAGDYINSNGSKVMHKWNYVLVDGKFYWLDVRMDNSFYASSGKLSHTYFMKTDNASWAKHHRWVHQYTDELCANAAKITAEYSQRIVQVSGVKISNSALALTVGQTAQLSASVSPSNATVKTIKWGSSDSGIAKVVGGKVTAVSAGECTIYATANNGRQAACSVTVTEPENTDSGDNS